MTRQEWRDTRGWDFSCFFCFRTIAGPLPSDWEIVLQSCICPACMERSEREHGKGGHHKVRGGSYADGRPDPADYDRS